MTSTTEELYNINPKVLADMNYKQAIELKIQRARAIMVTLLTPNFMEQDTHKINKINKAIKFNQQLLAELN